VNFTEIFLVVAEIGLLVPTYPRIGNTKLFNPIIHRRLWTILNRHYGVAHARYHVTCTPGPYVKFKYIFQFLTPNLPTHCVTFIGLRWRVFSVWTSSVNVKSTENFRSPQNSPNFDLLAGLVISGGGMKSCDKVATFTAKHPCVNLCRFSHLRAGQC